MAHQANTVTLGLGKHTSESAGLSPRQPEPLLSCHVTDSLERRYNVPVSVQPRGLLSQGETQGAVDTPALTA